MMILNMCFCQLVIHCFSAVFFFACPAQIDLGPISTYFPFADRFDMKLCQKSTGETWQEGKHLLSSSAVLSPLSWAIVFSPDVFSASGNCSMSGFYSTRLLMLPYVVHCTVSQPPPAPASQVAGLYRVPPSDTPSHEQLSGILRGGFL